MLLLEFLKSILIDLSSEGPTAKIKDTIDELALQEIVDSFLARKKDKNGQYSISEEYDYEGLLSYFQESLLDDVKKYLTAPLDRQEAYKRSILSKAENSALAKTPKAMHEIRVIVDSVLDIVFEYYYRKSPVSDRLLANYTIRNVKSAVCESAKEIIDTIASAGEATSEALDLEGVIESKRELALNQAIFPWFHHSIRVREAFSDGLFVEPVFKGNICYQDLPKFYNTNIVFLGPAGAGKSTMLLYLFAFSKITTTSVLYLTAKEANNNLDRLERINACPGQHGNKHLLMIDSIDEAFYNDYSGYERFVEKLKMLDNCRFWLGCRTEFYTTYFGENTAIAQESIELLPWGPKEYDAFVSNYSRLCHQNDLRSKIDALLGDKEENQSMKTNPFQLA